MLYQLLILVMIKPKRKLPPEGGVFSIRLSSSEEVERFKRRIQKLVIEMRQDQPEEELKVTQGDIAKEALEYGLRYLEKKIRKN